MSKVYEVTLYVTKSYAAKIIVEARDEDEADRLALDMYVDGDYPTENHTIDSIESIVIEELS